jgi:hypothetical protein
MICQLMFLEIIHIHSHINQSGSAEAVQVRFYYIANISFKYFWGISEAEGLNMGFK